MNGQKAKFDEISVNRKHRSEKLITIRVVVDKCAMPELGEKFQNKDPETLKRNAGEGEARRQGGIQGQDGPPHSKRIQAMYH